MSARLDEEIELIRAEFPNLEVREEDLWALIPDYPVPEDWGRESTAIAFQLLADPHGQEPYGFWVNPPLALADGSPPSNASGPVATPFGEGWQQFSWSLERWKPGQTASCGTNLRDFVRTFADRLRELN